MITKVSLNSINNTYLSNTSFSAASTVSEQSKPLSKKQKAAILGSSALGAALVLAFWTKRAGFSLNPKNIINTPIKDWAVFKFDPTEKIVKFKEPQIISIASGSIAGGFAGGLAVDKENRKAKQREVLNQILGNIIVPVLFVGMGARILGSHVENLCHKMPQLCSKNQSHLIQKIIKFSNSCMKNIPNTAATLAFLIGGIFAGNKVSNFINDKVYHRKVERNIRTTDFAPHLDDICMSVSLMNEASKGASLLARFIPPALVVPGYQVGKAQNK